MNLLIIGRRYLYDSVTSLANPKSSAEGMLIPTNKQLQQMRVIEWNREMPTYCRFDCLTYL